MFKVLAASFVGDGSIDTSGIDADRRAVLAGAEREKILTSKLDGVAPELLRTYIEKGADFYALIVDVDRWHANAGQYGIENERLAASRLADVGTLLRTHSALNDDRVMKHRDQHLEPETNRRRVGYTETLTDAENMLVVFDGERVTGMAFSRGPFHKMAFGHAVVQIKRNMESGEFVLPSLDVIERQVAKTRPRQFEAIAAPSPAAIAAAASATAERPTPVVTLINAPAPAFNALARRDVRPTAAAVAAASAANHDWFAEVGLPKQEVSRAAREKFPIERKK